MSKQLFKEELSNDLFVSGALGAGNLSVTLEFKVIPQLEKLEAKIAGKSGLGYKIAGYVLDFAKVYVAKAETEAPVA